jgi:hypothetical protein
MISTGVIFAGALVALWAFYYVMVWLLNVSSLSEKGFTIGLYIR